MNHLQEEIDKICRTSKSKRNAMLRIYRYLYDNNNSFSYVETIFPVLTNKRDLHMLDMYILDKLKANSDENIGGLGVDLSRTNNVVARGKGRDVNKIKNRTLDIPYTTLSYMWFLFNTDRNVYNTMCNELINI